MIQDIYPKKMSNAFSNIMPSENSQVIQFKEGEVLCRYDEEKRKLNFPRWKELMGKPDSIYLFSIDDDSYFLIPDSCDVAGSYEYASMLQIRRFQLSSNESVFAAFTAYHLWKWYHANQFCGACGKPVIRDTAERALICPSCGNKIYPRINPAVIIGVKNGNRILLTRYRTGYAHNALVAGFVEIGETMEETVTREVMEETGLKVKNIQYYKSQPWGVEQDILMGFFCEVDGDDTIRMDETELKYAEWVERQDIELQPTDYSLTNEMMKVFKNTL